MKIVGMVLGALLLVAGPASAAVDVRTVACPDEDLRLCRFHVNDVRDGEVVHVRATLPSACFPVVAVFRASSGLAWDADAIPGTYATVAGLVPGQVSFALVNESGHREDLFVDFVWGCVEE